MWEQNTNTTVSTWSRAASENDLQHVLVPVSASQQALINLMISPFTCSHVSFSGVVSILN